MAIIFRKSFTAALSVFVSIALIASCIAIAPRHAQAAASTEFGALKVSGKQLVGASSGKPVQLRGVSSHGINWDVGYPFVNEKAFKTLRDGYGVNCIRLAMYTTEYFGYCDKSGASESQSSVQKTLLSRIDAGVRAATDLGMYVIIDWHVLNDRNPKRYQSQAKVFFDTVAKKYAGCSNVIYEICNEPNGGTSWNDIKSYANSVIPVIRKHAPDALVICGTPNWSQDVDVAAKSPLSFGNVMYAVHFYASTHKDSYRNKVKEAYGKGLPIFASEFNISEASGNGNLNKAEGAKWLDLLDSCKISYCAWSLSNKSESCSLLKPGASKTGGWSASQLSGSGSWILGQYKARAGKPVASSSASSSATVAPSKVGKVASFKVKKKSSKVAVVSYARKSGASGYQVKYAKSKNFAGSKTVTTSKTKVTVKKLSKGKVYYFKVRAYKTIDGKRTYGAWTAAKKVRV